MDKKIDVFISYSHKDKEFAEEVLSELEMAGLSCFMAEIHIAPGELWELEIRKAIVNADRILLLITPNSKDSLWIAAEAGAAWALEKELIAGVRYVDSDELIEVIRKHQVHRIEATRHIKALIDWFVPALAYPNNDLTGQWLDPVDGDTAYFRQVGKRVVGYYDYGTGNQKIGIYRGELHDSVFEYQWEWIDKNLTGEGCLSLSDDGNSASGHWWFAEHPNGKENVQYRRVSSQMPEWLTEDDFNQHLEFLNSR